MTFEDFVLILLVGVVMSLWIWVKDQERDNE